jgi:hypothetical protein
VKPAQEQRSSETIAKEIAAALFIIKPYALNLPFGRSKSTSYSACMAKLAARPTFIILRDLGPNLVTYKIYFDRLHNSWHVTCVLDYYKLHI